MPEPEKIVKSNLIVDLSFQLAVEVVKYSDLLSGNSALVISKQLTKSGTSIGANVWESQNAESKQDFIHKLKIAAKEAKETHYWLLLCNKLNYKRADELIEKVVSIKKVLSKIISSSKQSSHHHISTSTN